MNTFQHQNVQSHQISGVQGYASLYRVSSTERPTLKQGMFIHTAPYLKENIPTVKRAGLEGMINKINIKKDLILSKNVKVDQIV